MSLQDIRSECSEEASLLQPFVDGELTNEEQERVASHLDGCRPCRAAVSEQLWVRAAVRSVEREHAPQALRARILAGLDAIDHKQAKQRAAEAPSLWTRASARVRDLVRGGLIMVPAGAVAVALFFVARQGVDPGGAVVSTTPIATVMKRAPAGDEATALRDVQPRVGFPIEVAHPRASQRIELVGARVDSASAPGSDTPGARLRYKVFRDGEAPAHVIHRQFRALGQAPQGQLVRIRGREYVLTTGDRGEPVLRFERSGIAHLLALEGAAPTVQDPAADPTRPDYAFLLTVADLVGGR